MKLVEMMAIKGQKLLRIVETHYQHVKPFEMCYVKEQVSIIVKIHVDSTKKRFKTN